MAVQKALAINDYYVNDVDGVQSEKHSGGGGGGGGGSTSKNTSSTTSTQKITNTQTTQTTNNKTLNENALESLLKITNVLKETLLDEVNADEEIESNNTYVNTYANTYVKTISTYIAKDITNLTYITYKSILPKNKNIEIIKNKVDDLKPIVDLKIDDLVNKGKITFEKKINVTYSYTYSLQNIIPNPLYNNYINDNYNNNIYATGDLDGITNTTYLKINKNNIVNNISKDYYLPSIGELGLSMENIQIINDSIDALGEEYSDCKIPYNAIIASSSLYSSDKISNIEYSLTNNINNVWCFNNTKAEITYKPIGNNFTILPFLIPITGIAFNLYLFCLIPW